MCWAPDFINYWSIFGDYATRLPLHEISDKYSTMLASQQQQQQQQQQLALFARP